MSINSAGAYRPVITNSVPECRREIDVVKQMFDLGFIIFHVLYELSDEDASSGTQNSNGKPKCGRCLSFPVASIDMYISFVFHIVDL